MAISDSNKAVLKQSGLLPATAKRMVDDLGYAEPDDLKVSACMPTPVWVQGNSTQPAMYSRLGLLRMHAV